MRINVLKDCVVFRAPAFLFPIYQTLKPHISEGSNLFAHRRQNLNPDTANADMTIH